MPKSFNKGVYWKEGDTVKDTNPRCTHYGSVGKVVKIGKGRTTFVVTNEGDTYKKGDKLTKTDNQLEKQAIAVSTVVGLGTLAVMGVGKAVKGVSKMLKGRGAAVNAAKAKQLQAMGKPRKIMPKMAEDKSIKVNPKYLNIKALPSGKPMVVHSPMDSVMYKVLSDTTKSKQNQAVLDSIRTGKLDPKKYNARIAKKNLKKEGELNMFNFTGQTKVAGMQKMKAFVDMGDSVEKAARKAYPDAPESAISDYVQKYNMNKDSKKTKKMYVDKVVMKRASLIQKAASKVIGKVANATLGYRGMLPGGTRKMPGQVGAVMPNSMGARGMNTGSY